MGGRTILYGIHPVREAIRAGRSLSCLYVLDGRRDSAVEDIVRDARRIGSPVRFEPKRRLDELARTDKHQGLVAVVAAQQAVSLEELVERAGSDAARPPALVILDEVEDPQNLGAVIRTADAAGAHGVIIPERRSAGLTPAVAKASAGALSHLPVVRVPNLRNAIDRLKKAGIWVMGLDVRGEVPYWEVDWRVPVALVAGAEGKGIRPLVREQCDRLVSLPMQGRVESLNVSVSVGVVLYEMVRQRLGDRARNDPSNSNRRLAK
jgi:23S rRNA (guanosine2251-2'-O)-methyltransferase